MIRHVGRDRRRQVVPGRVVPGQTVLAEVRVKQGLARRDPVARVEDQHFLKIKKNPLKLQ